MRLFIAVEIPKNFFDQFSEIFAKTSFAGVSIDVISLMQSKLSRDGATYHRLHGVKLIHT